MRSFTFDVIVRETASGATRMTEGVNWYRLAMKMVRAGKATLVENRKEFAGYGSSYDVGYNRHNLTVTEVV